MKQIFFRIILIFFNSKKWVGTTVNFIVISKKVGTTTFLGAVQSIPIELKR
ncbi:hypothetical protein LEP1GSC115_4130 [Leptospira interrogans serovar Australis str. 200703203]|uniref:Uncharacterized protein n=1 Tax=Leptospira interrogans serovar Australis str. 200703203 TaxID=1085541 RepID=N1UM20_LEPIR|nr:hypothetical protein LEP1GSC115_4130 [Leptospira interrogans serovar Australis str. 200703203]